MAKLDKLYEFLLGEAAGGAAAQDRYEAGNGRQQRVCVPATFQQVRPDKAGICKHPFDGRSQLALVEEPGALVQQSKLVPPVALECRLCELLPELAAQRT